MDAICIAVYLFKKKKDLEHTAIKIQTELLVYYIMKKR